MPRLTHSCPKYRLHKSSGQAIVTLAGTDHYLGIWRSRASKREYDRLIGEWLANGRLPAPKAADDLTITELIAAYWSFAKTYYVKHGQPTSQLALVRVALRALRQNYGPTAAGAFGPLALKAIQEQLAAQNLSRSYVNETCACIKRMFKWGVAQERVSITVFQALTTVPGLRRGRSAAREPGPIGPVTDAVVEATLPYLSPVVADMIRVQRLTGCRPGEVCMLRPLDLDTSGDVWAFRPESHKTEHHGRARVISIGPKAQEILRPYLTRAADAYCFSPWESEKQRRAKVHARRLTATNCGNRPGTNRKHTPNRPAGTCYDNNSYRRAIHRACDFAFPAPAPLGRQAGEGQACWQSRLAPQQQEQLAAWQAKHRWSPNRLRHAAATEIRRKYGLEAAQVTLGHASADVSQIYAERDMAKAAAVMREVG